MKNIVALLCFLPGVLCAGPWEDSFVGLDRSAQQDTLGRDEGRDLFSASANPAWSSPTTRAGASLNYHKGHVGARASESPEVMLVGLGGHFQKGSFGGGMLFVLPFLDSAVIDTGKASGRVTPWTARNRQLQMQPYVSKSFWEDHFRVGLMFPISFDVKSESELRLDSSEPNTRIKAGLDPNLTWGAGLWGRLGESAELSLAYRERKRSDAYVSLKGAVPVTGASNIDILASGSSPYIYEPRRVTGQSSFDLGDDFKFGLWVRYNQWKEMPAPVLLLQYTSPNVRTVAVDFKAKNTVELAAGLGTALGENLRLYASYRYSPSPFKNSVLFYDRDTHHLGLGTGLALAEAWQLALFGRLSILEEGGLYSYAGLGASVEL